MFPQQHKQTLRLTAENEDGGGFRLVAVCNFTTRCHCTSQKMDFKRNHAKKVQTNV